jgi:hypothetical protein
LSPAISHALLISDEQALNTPWKWGIFYDIYVTLLRINKHSQAFTAPPPSSSEVCSNKTAGYVLHYQSGNRILGPLTQAVSRRLPTAAARVPSQVRSCGIWGGQIGTATSLLPVLWFPLPIPSPLTAPYSLISLSQTLHSLDTGGVIK